MKLKVKIFLMLVMVLLIPSFLSADASNGLVLELTFDGNADDTSGYDNHGTLMGTAGYVPGKFGQALDLDGSYNCGVKVNSSPSLDFEISDFSISYWAKTTSSSRYIVSTYTGSYGYAFYNSGSRPRLWMKDSSDNYASATAYPSDSGSVPGLTDGKWHLVTVTVDRDDSAGMKFYVDNILIDQFYDPTLASESVTPGNALYLGIKTIQQSYNFIGQIDDVRLFNRILLHEEVSSLSSYNIF